METEGNRIDRRIKSDWEFTMIEADAFSQRGFRCGCFTGSLVLVGTDRWQVDASRRHTFRPSSPLSTHTDTPAYLAAARSVDRSFRFRVDR